MTKRRVMMYWEKDDDKSFQVETREGTFVQFGIGLEKTRDGSFSVTSAIVEMPDGRVRNMPLRLIRFLDVEKEGKNV